MIELGEPLTLPGDFCCWLIFCASDVRLTVLVSAVFRTACKRVDLRVGIDVEVGIEQVQPKVRLPVTSVSFRENNFFLVQSVPRATGATKKLLIEKL